MNRTLTGRDILGTNAVLARQTVKRAHFSSSMALAAKFDKTADRRHNWTADGIDRGIAELRKGRPDLVAEARKHLDKFTQQISIARREWTHTVAGYFPDVPAYLAGEPENMWHLQNEQSNRTPLRIWIGVTSSGGIPESQLLARGAALAAFSIALSNQRPVILTPYVNLGDSTQRGTQAALISWDLSTSPMVLSNIAACLASPQIIREFGIAACYVVNPSVTGAWMTGYNDEAYMRSQLKAASDDIYLGSIHLSDPLLDNPIQWITDHLGHYLTD